MCLPQFFFPQATKTFVKLQSKLLPTIWGTNNFTTSNGGNQSATNYLQHQQQQKRCPLSPCPVLGNASLVSSIGDLADHFNELGILDRKPTKRPPATYLCHLCFKKGHYIKDCPQVQLQTFFLLLSTPRESVFSNKTSLAIIRDHLTIRPRSFAREVNIDE